MVGGQETIRKSGEWLGAHKKEVVGYGLTAIAILTLAPALSQISSHSGPYYEFLVNLNSATDSLPGGHYVLETVNQLAHVFSSLIPQYDPKDVPMVHVAELLHTAAIVGSPIKTIIDRALSSKREARKLAGAEPVRQKETPSHVFFGPSPVVSDFTQAWVSAFGKGKID